MRLYFQVVTPILCLVLFAVTLALCVRVKGLHTRLDDQEEKMKTVQKAMITLQLREIKRQGLVGDKAW